MDRPGPVKCECITKIIVFISLNIPSNCGLGTLIKRSQVIIISRKIVSVESNFSFPRNEFPGCLSFLLFTSLCYSRLRQNRVMSKILKIIGLALVFLTTHNQKYQLHHCHGHLHHHRRHHHHQLNSPESNPVNDKQSFRTINNGDMTHFSFLSVSEKRWPPQAGIS